MFDGDEMNIHIAQSIQAKNELKRIANVKFQIIGAKDSNPIIGCVQDALSGCYLLTKIDHKISGRDAINFLCNTSSETKFNIDKNKTYSGHEIFSHIIPEGINNIVIKNDKKTLEINNGNLLVGILTKATLSTVKNSIIHIIWDKYGPDKTRKFIDDAQRLALIFLNYRGFTFSIRDCINENKKVEEQIKESIKNKILEYKVMLTQYENDIDQLNPDIIESNLSGELNAFSSDIGNTLFNSLNVSNNLFACIESGSKGNHMNLQHIMGCIGQKSVEGKRIKKKVENRSLPIFHKDDDTPEARGFIKNSYYSGIQAYEYFYDAMGGREGLIDTAIRTAKTGYIQRQLIKGLEDLIIKYDNTNRNSNNTIIQYIYGENGIDQANQTELLIRLISLNNLDIASTYGFNKDEIKKIEKEHKVKNFEKFNNTYINRIKEYRDNLRTIQAITTNNYKTLEEKYMLPINLKRLTEDYSKNKVNLELNPEDIINDIDQLLNSSETRLLAGVTEKDKNLIKDDRQIKYLFEIALHDYLCPKKCIFEYGLSKKDFKSLIDEIKLSFIKAMVQPGEMIGIIAAQSLGEPMSQMSLLGNQQAKLVVKNKVSNTIEMVTSHIGPFCDEIIKNNPELTYETGHINSIETELHSLENEYYIIGVDSKEKTNWNKISHVSRHPVNGNIMRIKTKSGRSVETTTSHSHLIRANQTVIPIVGANMKVGMRIPVAKHIDNKFIKDSIEIYDIVYKLEYLRLDYLCSIFNLNIKIPDFVFTAPNEFKARFLQNYIDKYGDFNYYISIKNTNEEIIKDISLLLNYFDIFGSIYDDDKTFTLTINSKYASIYKQHIGSLVHQDKLDELIEYSNSIFDSIDKINGLGEIIEKCNKELNLSMEVIDTINRETLEKYIQIYTENKDSIKITNELEILKQASDSNIIWDEVTEIEIYTPDQNTYVYDFTVPGNQTFMTDYGIIVHNTLNTKHSAGVASKSTKNMGVSRIEELLHYSKDIKTPQMTIYFDDNISNNRSEVNKISSYLTHLNIKELLKSAEIVYDISSIYKDDNVGTPFFVNNQKVELTSLPFIFRLKLNMEVMHDKDTTLLDIKSKFISHWTKNFTNLKNMKKIEKDIFSKISRCAILSNTVVDDPIIHIRFNMSSFNYNLLTEFLKIVLSQITLKGIDNIKSSDMINERKLSFDKETGDSVVSKQYIVYTDGINFEKIKYIKGLNHSLCTCNSIAKIYRLYGIEATRQSLINEFNETFNAGGSKSVNHNHMAVLVDFMTHTGGITSIDRHGLGKVDSEPIAKASFEKTMDHFLNAAVFNEKDHIQSVSSRVMLGRVIPGGTGAFELMLDTDKLENSEYTQNENGGRVTFAGLEEETLFKDIMKFGFSKNDFYLPV